MKSLTYKIIDVNGLYSLYYKDNPGLGRIIRTHSEQVAKKALSIINQKQLQVNSGFVYSASLLHDIGVIKCNAPDMGAKGDLPYICHGVEGRKLLENKHLYEIAKVCERHTGSGITKKEIIQNNLPLPKRDMMPITLEEKLICYADKFFSKSGNLEQEKSLETIINQLERYGKEVVERFLKLHTIFS